MTIINFMVPLQGTATKIFTYDGEDWHLTKGYKSGMYFQGIQQEVNCLSDLNEVIERINTKSAFMVHGDFIEGTDLSNMIRRKREHSDGIPPTIKDSMIEYMCIDIDGYNYDYENLTGPDAIEEFINKHLPVEFHKSSYIYQYSSSYKITTEKLCAHLFFRLKAPIFIGDLHNFFKDHPYVDYSIYRAAQPIYTQKRICIGKDDPVNEFNGFAQGVELVDWKPDVNEKFSPDKKEGNLVGLLDKNDFDLAIAVEKILSSENYHDSLNGVALSLANKKVPPETIKKMLQGAMNSAKRSIDNNDPKRMSEWQTRYEDIERSVDSAAEIVDNPTFEEINIWIAENDESIVRAGFAKKVVKFNAIDLKNIVSILDQKLKVGARAINSVIKEVKIVHQEEMAEIARKIRSVERHAKGIHEIEVTNETYGVVTSKVCNALARSKKKPEVYVLGSNNLSIVEIAAPKTVKQVTWKGMLKDDYPPMPVIKDISNSIGVMRARVEKDCVFISESGKSIICPDSILNAVSSMYGIKWNPLTGIVEHPFINGNWEIVQDSGYDKGTGLYALLHKKLKIILIDPHDAYNYLAHEVLAEFPFDTELDRALAVGAFMTAVQRPYISGDNGMPGFAIVSPKPSSGKTTLAQLLNYSIYNRPVAATGWSDNDEELGKHLLAILREGHNCVLFDNLQKDAAIQSNELAKAMTSATYSRRKLGSNETEEVPSSVFWLFTGNNILFKGDFTTRILPIRIVPKQENPEARMFKRKDIGQWAMDNRKKIISAVISIVVAGKDIVYEDQKKASRFKDWDRFVRLPLLKISGHDLLDGFQKNSFDDDEALAKGELLEKLHEVFQGGTFLTKDVMGLMKGLGKFGALDSDGSEYIDIITTAFSDKAAANVKTLGRYLLGMKDFILRGFMLTRTDGNYGAIWRVKKIEEN